MEPQTPLPQSIVASEEIEYFVEEFVDKLKYVDLTVPSKDMVETAMKQYYSNYVTEALISRWVDKWDPLTVVPVCEIPGRRFSNPYPDRAEIFEVSKETKEKYRVWGWIVFVYTGEGITQREKFTAIVQKSNLNWTITEFECGFTGPRG